MTEAERKVFSYRDDFETLWELAPPPQKLLLVWDDTPCEKLPGAGRVAVDSALTAYDWAVAMALHYPEPRWQLFLMDQSSESYPTAHAVQVFREWPGLL